MINENEILTKKYFKNEMQKEIGSLRKEFDNYVTKGYFTNSLQREICSLRKDLDNYVTKDYLKMTLKKELSNFVTRDYLKKVVQKELNNQKYDILREVRIMIHETMESSMENMKLYYQEETNRHMTALLQGFRDEMLVYKDQLMTHKERLDDHGHRIIVLEGR